VLVLLLAGASEVPARPQETPPSTESLPEAARHNRERKAHSARHPRLITNADFDDYDPVPNVATFDVPSSLTDATEVPPQPTSGTCDTPEARRLSRDLRVAAQELAHLQSELSYQAPTITHHDLDMQYFRPGNAGLNVGSPPMLNSQPLVPWRVAQVEVEQRIVSLQQALRVVCEPPAAARIQLEIDDLEQQLHLLQRDHALDQDSYYSKTDFAHDTAGRAHLDAEQRQIQLLQSQIELLKEELAAMNLPQAEL
jgi:hypothetical protein